eukprot:gb/GECG01012270.1/.p1 GENE.gb/GECG01012270.1/~~gb/GECG01012270.1/.p1  ORF type:complete len:1822 (+),score=208.24 gb/GECG01012270.1/:1-5466(+)
MRPSYLVPKYHRPASLRGSRPAWPTVLRPSTASVGSSWTCGRSQHASFQARDRKICVPWRREFCAGTGSNKEALEKLEERLDEAIREQKDLNVAVNCFRYLQKHKTNKEPESSLRGLVELAIQKSREAPSWTVAKSIWSLAEMLPRDGVRDRHLCYAYVTAVQHSTSPELSKLPHVLGSMRNELEISHSDIPWVYSAVVLYKAGLPDKACDALKGYPIMRGNGNDTLEVHCSSEDIRHLKSLIPSGLSSGLGITELWQALRQLVRSLKQSNDDKRLASLENEIESVELLHACTNGSSADLRKQIQRFQQAKLVDMSTRSFYEGALHAEILLQLMQHDAPDYETDVEELLTHFLHDAKYECLQSEYMASLVSRLLCDERGLLPSVWMFGLASRSIDTPTLFSSQRFDRSSHLVEEGIFDPLMESVFNCVRENSLLANKSRTFCQNLVPLLGTLFDRNEISRESFRNFFGTCTCFKTFDYAMEAFEMDASKGRALCSNLSTEASEVMDARLLLSYLCRSCDLLKVPGGESLTEIHISWKIIHDGIQGSLQLLDGEARSGFPSLKSLETQPNAIRVLTQLFPAPTLSEMLAAHITVIGRMKSNESTELSGVDIDTQLKTVVEQVKDVDVRVRHMHESLSSANTEEGFTLKALLHADSFFAPIAMSEQQNLIQMAVQNRLPFSAVWDLYEWTNSTSVASQPMGSHQMPYNVLDSVIVSLIDDGNVDGLFRLLSSVNDGFWREGLNKLKVAMNSEKSESSDRSNWLYYLLEKEEMMEEEGPLGKLVDLLKEEELWASDKNQQAYIALAYIREAYKLFHSEVPGASSSARGTDLEPKYRDFAVFPRDRNELLNRQMTSSFTLSHTNELDMIKTVLGKTENLFSSQPEVEAPGDGASRLRQIRAASGTTSTKSPEYSLRVDPISSFSETYFEHRMILKQAREWGLHHGYCGLLPQGLDKTEIPLFLWKDAEIIDFVKFRVNSASLVRPSSAATSVEVFVKSLQEWVEGNLPPFEFVQDDSSKLEMFDSKQLDGSEHAHRSVLAHQAEYLLKYVVQPAVFVGRKEYTKYVVVGHKFRSLASDSRWEDFLSQCTQQASDFVERSLSSANFVFRPSGPTFKRLQPPHSAALRNGSVPGISLTEDDADSLPSANPQFLDTIGRGFAAFESDRPNGWMWPWGSIHPINETGSNSSHEHNERRKDPASALSSALAKLRRDNEQSATTSTEALTRPNIDEEFANRVRCLRELNEETRSSKLEKNASVLVNNLSKARRENSQKWMDSFKLANFGLLRDELRLTEDMHNVVCLGKPLPWPLRKAMYAREQQEKPDQGEPEAIRALKTKTARTLSHWQRKRHQVPQLATPKEASSDNGRRERSRSIDRMPREVSEAQALLMSVESPSATYAANVHSSSVPPAVDHTDVSHPEIAAGQHGNCFVFTRRNMLGEPIPHPVLGYYRNKATAEGYANWIRFAVPLMQQYTVQKVISEWKALADRLEATQNSEAISTKPVSAALGEVGLPVEWYLWGLELHPQQPRFPKSNSRVIRAIRAHVYEEYFGEFYWSHEIEVLRNIDQSMRQLQPLSRSILAGKRPELRSRSQMKEESFDTTPFFDEAQPHFEAAAEIPVTDEIVAPESGVEVATKVNQGHNYEYAFISGDRLESSLQTSLDNMDEISLKFFDAMNRQSSGNAEYESTYEVSWMPDRSDSRNPNSKDLLSSQQSKLIRQVQIERAKERKANIRNFGFDYLKAHTTARSFEAAEFLQQVAQKSTTSRVSNLPSMLTPVTTPFMKQFQGGKDVETLARLWIAARAPWCIYQASKELNRSGPSLKGLQQS